MNTTSEVHESALRIIRATKPTRKLTDLSKPARYVNAASTDIRATFKKFERLERMKARAA